MYKRQEIDEWHELLKANLYPENHVLRRKIDEAFLITERPSKSAIYSITDNFDKSNTMAISILAIYDSKFSIQGYIHDNWLAREVAKLAKYLLDYPKLAYVNYPRYVGSCELAIDFLDDILKVDEYRSFWSDFSAGSKGITGTDLTQMKLQLKHEVKAELHDQMKQELKDQLKQEVKAELKDQLKQEVKAELKDQLKEEVKQELNDRLKQEVKAELKVQLKQEVKAELKHLLERMTSNWN